MSDKSGHDAREVSKIVDVSFQYAEHPPIVEGPIDVHQQVF
jgi:hypothetical protein